MPYASAIRLIYFVLTLLVNDPDLQDSEFIPDLNELREKTMQLLPSRGSSSRELPYKLYTLDCAIQLLDEFYDSVPLLDGPTRAKLMNVKSHLAQICDRCTLKKEAVDGRIERFPTLIR